VKHDTGKEFNCDYRTLRAETYCSERGENCNETTDGGVFFRHIGCPHKNPFWNADRSAVEVPVGAEETSALFQLDFGHGRDIGVKVQHWLLGVLGLVPEESPEMWFPAMLLRATAETSSLWKRVGVLVELAGARESGKTILAMMSMNQHGYTLVNGASHEIEVRDYIYSSHTNEGQFRRYVETLHLSTLLRDGQRRGLFLPQGTFRSRNVKVSFIKPSKNLPVPTDDGVDEDFRWPKRFAMKALFAIPNAVKRIVSETSLTLWQIVHSANDYPFWYTVIFYDTAGEANDARDMQLELDAIDKVAIVVNAGEIFGLSKKVNVADERKGAESDELEEDDEPESDGAIEDQSIKTACDRIAKGIDRKQKLYLIVTQMDRIKEHIGGDWQRVEIIADSIGSKKLNREAKGMLSEWLSRSPASHAKDLKNKLRLVNDVFFVWTEDLPKSSVPERQAKMPRSRGLAKFICDCLDVKMSQITK
jgi:hypothetical protein